MPFILRGVNLLGINSVLTPRDVRLEVWHRIATRPAAREARPHLHARSSASTNCPRSSTTTSQGRVTGRTRGEDSVSNSRHRRSSHPRTLTHLQRLEAESIHIMREVVAECEQPVMLYSIGKDSSVMLHLALKAFYPVASRRSRCCTSTRRGSSARCIAFRDAHGAASSASSCIVHTQPGRRSRRASTRSRTARRSTPTSGRRRALKQALDKYGFDAAFGGARRDEEKSRAKERIFSFRSAQHRWDPKKQRPELWRLYNARKHKGESIRVFPLSNWTELDIWQYIHLREHPDRAAVLRRGAAGGRARRRADHGRRRAHAARARARSR